MRAGVPRIMAFAALVLALSAALVLRGGDAVSGLFADPDGGSPVLIPSSLAVNFGAYDPEGVLADAELAVDHYFVQWQTYAPGALTSSLLASQALGRWPLVTIEPFADTGAGLRDETLLDDIAAGRYDLHVDQICSDLGDYGQPLFIRWGHEMENVTGRYPWASEDSAAFIAAYRYFVTRCRAEVPDAYFVWSPAGDARLREYWPGPEYADYVGVSVFAHPDYDLLNFGHVRSFEEIFGARYQNVAGFQRPVLVAEMGVTGGIDHRRDWFTGMLTAASNYPQLRTIVYFEAIDTPGVWGELPTPDWRVPSEFFQKEPANE